MIYIFNKFVMTFMWLVGWISGGGMLTALITWLMTLLHIMPANETFVTGCIWGTVGVFMGNFMVNQFNRANPEPEKIDKQK